MRFAYPQQKYTKLLDRTFQGVVPSGHTRPHETSPTSKCIAEVSEMTEIKYRFLLAMEPSRFRGVRKKERFFYGRKYG